jgi:Domain of unknown function (DUF4115)
MPGEERGQGFEEQAALEELQRIQQALEESRRRRRQANEAFDSFLRSFGPRAQPRIEERQVREPEFEDVQVAQPPPGESPVAEERTAELPSSESRNVPAALAGGRRSRRLVRPFTVAAAAVIVAAALFLVRQNRSHDAARLSSETPTAPAVPAAASRPDTPPVVQPPPPATTTGSAELTALRPVWVRVLVDGQPVLERELPANARIPLAAKESIVIRAGNAGALRLSIAGTDQGSFGREGQVVTKTFKVPSSQGR